VARSGAAPQAPAAAHPPAPNTHAAPPSGAGRGGGGQARGNGDGHHD
jgi:hypothetical protein